MFLFSRFLFFKFKFTISAIKAKDANVINFSFQKSEKHLIFSSNSTVPKSKSLKLFLIPNFLLNKINFLTEFRSLEVFIDSSEPDYGSARKCTSSYLAFDWIFSSMNYYLNKHFLIFVVAKQETKILNKRHKKQKQNDKNRQKDYKKTK